jgi:hypothetical protein
MDTLKGKVNTIAESELQMLLVEKSLKILTELSFTPDYKSQESMPKSPHLNGNIKSESPRGSNVVTTCGWQDTSSKEWEKFTESTVTLNQSQFKEIGMDQDVIATSHSTKPEKMEVLTTSSNTACLN